MRPFLQRRWLIRQRRRAEGIASVWRRPPWVPPGHFYSPVSTEEDIERALSWDDPPNGIDLRETEQLELMKALEPYLSMFVSDRYVTTGNKQYGPVDAVVLQAMLRHYRPKRIIEVGSGHSTSVMLDTAQHFLPELKITCIEPYPDRLLGLLRTGDSDRIELLVTPVQDVCLQTFEALGPNDLLFLDSTHVVKHGSDVLWEVLHVLPRLAPGVVVHVHDIHWPFRYPEGWLREGRDWGETYLWHSFLAFNKAWPIRLMTSWLASARPEAFPEVLRDRITASLWVQRDE
jgi:predicted O-methyltransferase YrrM